MRLCEISPFVAHVSNYTYVKEQTLKIVMKCSYEYRLTFINSGSFRMKIGGEVYDCEPNDMLFWLPGQWYSGLDGSVLPADMISVFFCFTRGDARDGSPRSPVTRSGYNGEYLSPRVEFSDCEAFNRPFILKDVPDIRNMVGQLYKTDLLKNDINQLSANAQLTLLLLELSRLVSAGSARVSTARMEHILSRLRNDFIGARSCDLIARELGYHPNYLNRVVKAATGLTLHEYLLQCRIHTACDMLRSTELKVSELAYSLGFADCSHFIREFRKRTGVTPGGYRRA